MPPIVTLTMNPALDIATETEAIVPAEKLRCGEPRYDPGGGGINVARAVHMLGGDTIAVFPVGGLSGEMLCHLVADECVPHAAVAVDGITRESFAVVERQSWETVSLSAAWAAYRGARPGPLPRRTRCASPAPSTSSRVEAFRPAARPISTPLFASWRSAMARGLCSIRRDPPSPVPVGACS